MSNVLKLNVKSIGEDPRPLSVDLPASVLDLDTEVRTLGPVTVRLQVHRTGERVYLQGEVQARLTQICDRCLQEAEILVQAPVTLLAVPAEEGQPPAVDGDDKGVLTYSGEQLDLLPEVRSVLLLAIPMKSLCRPDCRGLCPDCGARLDDGPCECGSSVHPNEGTEESRRR